MPDLRMPDINKVILAGNLTRDPELKYIPSGTALCKLGLAVNRKFKTKSGELKEDTLFINVDVWGASAEFCGQNLRKGRAVMVEGRLKSDDWEDKNTGQKRTSFSVTADRVQMLSWEDRGGSSSAPAPRRIEEPVPEDDIPF